MDNQTEPRFECCHCSLEVTPNAAMGTRHRNHCNHCLWSKHVDTAPGDRASACQGCMEPVGVTLKREGVDKYGKEKLGDIMLVHRCQKCGQININRIAADDPEDLILQVFDISNTLPSPLSPETSAELKNQSITFLTNKKELKEKLFGKSI
jgi:hypothetical protein